MKKYMVYTELVEKDSFEIEAESMEEATKKAYYEMQYGHELESVEELDG